MGVRATYFEWLGAETRGKEKTQVLNHWATCHVISAFHDEHKKKTSLWIFCRLLWAWMLPKCLLVWEVSIMSNSTQISVQQLHLWVLLKLLLTAAETGDFFPRPSAAQQCRSGMVPSSPDCAYPQWNVMWKFLLIEAVPPVMVGD